MPNSSDTALRQERRDAEVALLQAMYPDQVVWNVPWQEITYQNDTGKLQLRLPDEYPGTSSPTLLSAMTHDKRDARDMTRSKIAALGVPVEEEALDAILQAFNEVVASLGSNDHDVEGRDEAVVKETGGENVDYKTVVIWLHHLLNTRKRKQALSPSTRPGDIAGISKPGYPGVIIVSGDAQAVDAHVAELRSQRWQAFQVRYDDYQSVPWAFSHGSGMAEVETMAEIAQSIQDVSNREVFLKAIGVK